MVSKAATVTDFLKELPADRRSALEKLRKRVKKVAPKARESMQYGMPSYVVGEMPFCGFNSQKNYMALYVCYTYAVSKNRKALGKLNCCKGCIRFRKIEDLPMDVAEKILVETLATQRASA